MINVKIGETDLTLVNIYAPNNESHRIQFFKRMKTFINNNSNNISNTILFGDFNCKLNSTTDKSSKLLKEIIKQMKCLDLCEEKNNTPMDLLGAMQMTHQEVGLILYL